jgi:hypothetical protein
MLIFHHLMTWGVSFLPAKAVSLGDTLFLFIPTFNRKSYRRVQASVPVEEPAKARAHEPRKEVRRIKGWWNRSGFRTC